MWRRAGKSHPLVGENRPDLVTLSVHLPWVAQRPSLQGLILLLRAVFCTDTKTTGARCLPTAVRLPTREPALVPGASCVDRGSSLGVYVPPRRSVPRI